ncbi:MAG TPA: chemotaxis protein CheB [Candidatus Thermoplasmatota archaeon]|nr:chemotaxis protein CheB [Candidatus Thermoplasmatota archaeon]
MVGSAGALPVILAQLNKLTSPNEGVLFVAYHRVDLPEFRLEKFAPRCAPQILRAMTGHKVEASFVYYPDGAQDLTVSRGRLRTSRSAARHHPNLDRLLGSLAAEYGARVTAILLSGMARDGLAGLEAVRKAGGRVIVQSPGSSSFPQLLEAAIAAGLGDSTLDLPEIHALVSQTLAGS